MSELTSLTTEKLPFAVGIDTQNPRFAWKIKSDKKALHQVSYRIAVKCPCGRTVWESGTVQSSKMQVRYSGEKLRPAENYTWEAEVTLSDGETLSSSADFMTGLLDSGLFSAAEWISLPHAEGFGRDSIPAFRREFALENGLKSAKLFTTGCGVYTAFLNGERVCNLDKNGCRHINELTPGFTDFAPRRLYHSYDVTHMLREGCNCLSAVSSGSWWSDPIMDSRGEFSAIRFLLILSYADGTSETVVTDEQWKVSADSPVRAAGIYLGEDYDARIPMDFVRVGFDDSAWTNAALFDEFKGEVSAHVGPPVVCRDDLCRSAAKIYTYNGARDASDEAFGIIDNVKEYPSADFVLHAGETAVIDFAQNASGRDFFRIVGKAGTTVTVRHGEMLNDGNGARSRGCDGPEGSVYLANMRSARAALVYTIGCDGIPEEFRPLHTFFGYRYVSITATSDVHFLDYKAEVITSIGYDSGKVECGNELVNKLILNSKWGMYSNYLSVPTDCPQRDERLGWMADTQVYTTTAQYYSTAASSFHEKWATDIRDSQRENGAYTSISPIGRSFGAQEGALGWADAGILAPYYVWRMTGDTTILNGHYESMVRYMDYLEGLGMTGPMGPFGDWLAFEENDGPLMAYLGVCYYAWDALCMSEIARALGFDADADKYAAVYEREKAFFIEQYVKEDGSVTLCQQTACLFALKLKLLPDDRSYAAVMKQLTDNIAGKGFRLQTGFLGTSILLPTLSEYGMNDIAYKLLLQDALPSWLYSVKAGATTIWERWNSYSVEDGFGDVSMNSFNHYAYGCVSEWIFSYMAGIRPADKGFKSFVLAPVPDPCVGYVKAEYDSVCGMIRSAWRYENGKIVYECTVPANTSATLIHPVSGEETVLESGDYRFIW